MPSEDVCAPRTLRLKRSRPALSTETTSLRRAYALHENAIVTMLMCLAARLRVAVRKTTHARAKSERLCSWLLPQSRDCIDGGVVSALSFSRFDSPCSVASSAVVVQQVSLNARARRSWASLVRAARAKGKAAAMARRL